ncbi:mitochondrial 2-oxoglutarate/malate carrier protein-like [Galleria mellonella]|uniref:Mitochondrial 2-oxoglutarate/malate carrier protein-like n=1 Tax=Galleria mellonella TaxID=7137 RepID=A0A6J1WDJ8_GALME|nr:mitochondrial 2-oxoglutarate/malate carrier protein-like [Galleria mellonella]
MADNRPAPKTIPGWINFVIGGLSGMMATCIVQPADLLKTRMQLLGPEAKGQSAISVAKGILRKEGPMGFYVGLSAGLFRQATYTTGRLGSFNTILDWYKAEYGVPSFSMKILMGMTAGGIGAFIGTPAEVSLIRMTADGRLPPEKRRNYKNVFNALNRIVREEGVTALWRGAVPTVTRAMVVNAAQLGTYSQARELLLPTLGEGIVLHLWSSMIAGFVTSAASLPVDIVKTRVQMAAKGSSQIGVLLNIVKNEGVMALWSGFLPTLIKIGPHTVFTFIFLEQLNALYLNT